MGLKDKIKVSSTNTSGRNARKHSSAFEKVTRIRLWTIEVYLTKKAEPSRCIYLTTDSSQFVCNIINSKNIKFTILILATNIYWVFLPVQRPNVIRF